MEKDWSSLAMDFEKRQDYIVGRETAFLLRQRVAKFTDLGATLECGCGNGNFTKLIASNADSVIAMDISEDMTKMAQLNLAACSNVVVRVGDSYHLDFSDNSFDTVFMANLIHVVSDPRRVIDESLRVLSSKGRIIIASYTQDGMKKEEILALMARYHQAFGKRPAGGTPFNLVSLCKMLTEKGFSIISQDLVGVRTKALVVVGQKEI